MNGSGEPVGPSGNTPESVMEITLAGRRLRVSRFTFLLLLGVVVGAVTGCVAVIFRLAAFYGERLLFPASEHSAIHVIPWLPPWLLRLLMPAVGGLVSGLILYRLLKYAGGHSIPAILQAVASGQSYFKASMAFPPSMAIVTIATGGSVGPEGPIAEIGSVTGSLIGRWARIPPRLVKTLIGAGVAAGIAAVFNSPIGGVFFAIEVILRNYEIASLTPILVAAVVSSVIAQAALGDRMAIEFPNLGDIPAGELPWFAVLGLLCGALSFLYIHGLGACHGLFRRSGIALWARPMVGGVLVGLIGILFPEVMGEGYEFIRGVIHGSAAEGSVLLLLMLVVLKIAATGFSLGSGNPGGSFAPAVFIGVMAGAAYGYVLRDFRLVQDVAPYAMTGMAGLIAGGLGAPITAILITIRHGGADGPEIILPVMTTVALCFFVMQLQRNVSVYTLEFLRLGIDLDRARQVDPLSLVRVRSVVHTADFDELPADMPVRQALAQFKESAARWFVVRGEGGQFAGIVSLHEMRLAIAEEELADLLVLADITDSFQPRLHEEMSLKEALASFNATEAEVLPVFKDQEAGSEFRGVVSRQDALNAYCECTEQA